MRLFLSAILSVEVIVLNKHLLENTLKTYSLVAKHSMISILEHIGHVGKMSFSGYNDQRFKPRLHQYVSMSVCRVYILNAQVVLSVATIRIK